MIAKIEGVVGLFMIGVAIMLGPFEKFYYYRGFVDNLKENSRRYIDKYSHNSKDNHEEARKAF